MGAGEISDVELTDLGVQVNDRTKDDDRMLIIPDKKFSEYVDLVKRKLAGGFWNEIVGEKEITFIFKFKDGSVREYKLSPDNEKEINDLCVEFNDEPPDLSPNVYKYISENKLYHDFMMRHYKKLIDRQL
jgi:hypothetical protein